jgi:hypothetical protein
MTDNFVSVSENILAFGSSHFYREVVVPLADHIEALARQYPVVSGDEDWRFYVRSSPQASGIEVAGFVGVISFVGIWAAEKALEELYNQKLGPLLRSKIGVCFKSDKSQKRYGVSLVINKSPVRTSIVIVCVDRSLSEIERSERQMGSVISMALREGSNSKSSGEVHLYIIEGGDANQHPWVYPDISGALQHLRGMSPVKPPRFVPYGR